MSPRVRAVSVLPVDGAGDSSSFHSLQSAVVPGPPPHSPWGQTGQREVQTCLPVRCALLELQAISSRGVSFGKAGTRTLTSKSRCERENKGPGTRTSGARPCLPRAPSGSVRAREARATGSRGAGGVRSRGSRVLHVSWAPAPGSSEVFSSASVHSCLQDAGSLRVGTREQVLRLGWARSRARSPQAPEK